MLVPKGASSNRSAIASKMMIRQDDTTSNRSEYACIMIMMLQRAGRSVWYSVHAQ